MKKFLFLFMMCALLPRTAVAQGLSDRFTISDLEYDPDVEAYYFIVSLEGSTIYTAYNLDIFLPNGINVVYSEDGGERTYYVLGTEDEDFYPFTKVGPKKTFKHSVGGNVLDGNQLRVSCIAQDNSEFKSGSGTLFFVYVTIDESVFTSSFSPKPIVKLSGMNLTKKDETAFHPADFACRPFTTDIPTSRTLPVNVSATNKVGTLILPFNAELPTGLKAYSCSAVKGDLLTLTEAQSIETCKPYIVYAENGYSGNLSGTAELSDANNVTDVFTDGFLTGLLTSGIVNTGYILQNKGQGDGPMFYDAEGVNFSLPAGRCYLTPSGSEAKVFSLDFDEATSIKAIQNSKFKMMSSTCRVEESLLLLAEYIYKVRVR